MRENQKDIIVCGLAKDFLITRTSFVSHLLPQYCHFSKIRFVKKYSPLLPVVLCPHREDRCIKQKHLSQFLSAVFVSGFVFSDESHDKISGRDEAIFESNELWLGGEKLFACTISTRLI